MTSSHNTISPNIWDVVFSIKTFIAAMLALLIALCFDLTNPYWAVGTVYIVAHPLSGANTSKAIYRLIGTAIGGAMAIILVPNLVDSPELLTLTIALWMAFCLGVSLLDRTPRSYSFMLAGYTTALTGFPIVASPETAFTYPVARVEEIALGIICAALVSRLVFPRHAGPVLAARIDSWVRDVAALAISTLNSSDKGDALQAAARKLAADAVDLHSFTTHVAYDTSGLRDMVGRTRTLQQRMVAMLPVVSGLADLLHAFRKATDGKLTASANELIRRVTELLSNEASYGEAERQEILALMEKTEQGGREQQEWNGLLAHNFTSRLRDLLQIWSDCLALREDIETGGRRELRWQRFGTLFDRTPIHRDYGMAIHSGLAVMLSTFIAAALWIFTGWSQGAAAAMMAGVLCCIFATMDDPAPMMLKFMYVSIFAVAVAFVFEFGLLPLVHGYLPLAAALGLVLIPAGVLMPKPSLMIYGLGFGVNFPNMLALQDRLNPDLSSFLNSNLAMVIGLVIACGTTVLVRSVGAEWTAYRVLRAGWADIVAVARKSDAPDFARLLYRMVDRFGLVAPRLARIPVESAVAQNDILGDLRNGLNTMELQRHRQLLTRDSREDVDQVLSGIAGFYQQKQKHGHAQPSEGLLKAIDTSLVDLINQNPSSAVEGARRAITSLRYNLYPDARFVMPDATIQAGGQLAKENAA
ncbi:FUSC family protein [Rhizobium sp. NPDC090275]|uniref:FUSC family protein n=1 Tax=Rhizobium sp. NPDC090275 TaxID=3364498 RepID=UPI000DDCBEE0